MQAYPGEGGKERWAGRGRKCGKYGLDCRAPSCGPCSWEVWEGPLGSCLLLGDFTPAYLLASHLCCHAPHRLLPAGHAYQCVCISRPLHTFFLLF